MSECKFAVEAFHAYIESIGLSRPAGTLGELKAFKAGADWQRSLAQAELAALNGKAAVPDWMASSSQFAERAYLAGWRDLADAQHEGIAVMYDELAAAPVQPQIDGVMVPRELLDRFPEINMSNFGADEVELLNDWGIEVSLLGGEA